MTLASHDCRICGEPHAAEPVMGKLKVGRYEAPVVIGYVHAECKRRRSEQTARRTWAEIARKWEDAGQMTFGQANQGAPAPGQEG